MDPHVSPTRTPDSPVTPKARPNRRISPLMLVGLTALILGLAGSTYWLLTKPDAGADRQAAGRAARESTGQSAARPLTDIKQFTLVPPTALGGLKPVDLGVPEANDYRSGVTGDGCELQFGIFSPAQVTGANLDDIVARQLASIRQAKGTVQGPQPGPALVLKDAADPKATYSLPTLVFSLSMAGSQGLSHYSAGVLPDDRRVVITRLCLTKDGKPAPRPDDVKAIDDIAGRITVKTAK